MFLDGVFNYLNILRKKYKMTGFSFLLLVSDYYGLSIKVTWGWFPRKWLAEWGF